MALVCVHGPLRKLAGGQAEHPVDAGTLRDLLRALEDAHPALAGWMLDERGAIRRHLNAYVNGELAGEDTQVGDGDRVELLPAISGG